MICPECKGMMRNLRSFERTYRSQLRSYFEDKLAELAGTGADASA